MVDAFVGFGSPVANDDDNDVVVVGNLIPSGDSPEIDNDDDDGSRNFIPPATPQLEEVEGADTREDSLLPDGDGVTRRHDSFASGHQTVIPVGSPFPANRYENDGKLFL